MVRAWLLPLFALLALAAPAPAQRKGMSYGMAPQPGPPELELANIGIDPKIGEQVPLDLPFVDEDGKPITIGEAIGGKPTILVLAYYRCPQLCTEVLTKLVECLRRIPEYGIGKDFNVVTVSFDPKDKPALAWEKKQTYLREYGREGAEKGWRFLTGQQPSIDAIAQAVGFRYVYDKQRKEYLHASGIMIVKPTGVLSRYFYGLEYVPLDVRLGLVDMDGAGRISATTADRLLLTCGYQYDKNTGHYNGAVMVILRAVFGVFTLALGAYLIRSWRRSRRKTEPAAAAFAGSNGVEEARL